MIKSDKNTRGIKGVLNLARKENPQIGSYEMHLEGVHEGYRVKLSNGAITIPEEVAQDYEAQPSSVTPERVKPIAKSFKKS